MKKKIISILLILVLSTLLIVGCAKKQSVEQITEKTTDTEAITDDVSTQISDIDSIDEDLDDSDLDNLEEDFANIDW